MITIKKGNENELKEKIMKLLSTVTSEKLLQYVVLIIEALLKKERVIIREIGADIKKSKDLGSVTAFLWSP